MEGLVCVRDDCGDGLVDMVLFCCGDSFEVDLRWVPMLGGFVDLVVLVDVASDGVTLVKTIEALRGAFFLFQPAWS